MVGVATVQPPRSEEICMLRLMTLITAVFSMACWGAATSPRESETDQYAIVKGMTVSCPGAGQIWGSDAMVECMADLKTLGVNWIAIHPYAGIREDGTVGSRYDRMYGEDVSWLTRPIAEAHRLGLKIMVKPHIAYWGSKFSWRGEITFETDEAWTRFFETYERWITRVAELSVDADAFVVGTELEATVQHEMKWRQIIDAVREKTTAPLTYAANWDRYERVRFWDALDVIGIQGYFPLVNHTELPSTEELERGWQRVLEQLERYSRTHGKKVVLAELGYNRSAHAAREPWDHRSGGPNAAEVQRRCMVSALKALEGNDVVVGAFLWKWFPSSRWGGGNFVMDTPVIREVIAERWDER